MALDLPAARLIYTLLTYACQILCVSLRLRSLRLAFVPLSEDRAEIAW